MPTLVSPGTAGGPDVTIAASRLTGPRRFSRQALVLGHAQAYRPVGGTAFFQIQVLGLNTLWQHFAVIPEATADLSAQAVNFFGGKIVEHAVAYAPFQDQTGDTRASIHHTMFTTQDDVGADVGPTTFYSPFLEYGTVHNQPYPFMIPALDAYENPFVQTMLRIATIGDQFTGFDPPASDDPHLNRIMQGWRRYLYTTQKAMGDIQAFGGIPGIGPLRSGVLGLARYLGDIQSIVGGTVGMRIQRRLRGRVTGNLIGVGSRTVFVDRSYSAFIGGAGGLRIYNRVAGHAMAGGVFSGFRFGRFSL